MYCSIRCYLVEDAKKILEQIQIPKQHNQTLMTPEFSVRGDPKFRAGDPHPRNS